MSLDLSNLTVITECASGYYAYTPIIAALSGAKVFALGKNTRYGTFIDNKKYLNELSKKFEVESQILIEEVSSFNKWNKADIITNSGMLRPIKSDVVNQFKKTAVIPLMWEPWEFRPGEIDIETCQKKEIPVIGTDENYAPIDMYQYPGMLAIYILNQLQSDYSTDRIVVVGGGLTGSMIVKTLLNFSKNILWYADSSFSADIGITPKPLNKLNEVKNNDFVDVLLFAEHTVNTPLFDKSHLDFKNLITKFPDLMVGHLCGSINKEELIASKVDFFPEEIAPFGYMSILPDMFGPKPTLKLMAAGLKVGEIAAKSRLNGNSIEQAIQDTIDYGIGMDFKGGFMNYGK